MHDRLPDQAPGFSRRAIFLAAILCALLINIAGAYIYFTDGAPDRLPSEVLLLAAGQFDINPRRDECHQPDAKKMNASSACRILVSPDSANLPIRYISFGDSFSNTLMPALEELSREYKVNGLQTSFSSCPPVSGIYRFRTFGSSYRYHCKEFNDAVLDIIRKDHIRTVILFARWSAYTQHYIIGDQHSAPPADMNASVRIFEDRFLKTLAMFDEMGINVWIVGQPPEYQQDIPQILSRTAMAKGDLSAIGMSATDLERQNSFMKSLERKTKEMKLENVHFLDLTPYLCDKTGQCAVQAQGRSLYRDESHLSVFGAGYIRPALEKIFTGLSEDDRTIIR